MLGLTSIVDLQGFGCEGARVSEQSWFCAAPMPRLQQAEREFSICCLRANLFNEATVTVTLCVKSHLCGKACKVCDDDHKFALIYYDCVLALSMTLCVIVAVAALLPLHHSI